MDMNPPVPEKATKPVKPPNPPGHMPINTARSEELVRREVRSINRDLTLQGVVAIVWGLLSGFSIFMITWASCFMLHSHLPLGPTTMALIITGVFLLVATISTLRGVIPQARAYNEQEDVLGRRLGYLVMGRPLNILGASSGITMVIMHCPASLLAGWGYLRHRLPSDEATLKAAADVLARVASNAVVDIAAVRPPTPPLAAIVLIRTGLAKASIRGEQITLTPTTKAREGLASGTP